MKKEKDEGTLSQRSHEQGNAETAFELINKYGTYEIQPTSDTENAFPKIAQGLPKKRNREKRKGVASLYLSETAPSANAKTFFTM